MKGDRVVLLRESWVGAGPDEAAAEFRRDRAGRDRQGLEGVLLPHRLPRPRHERVASRAPAVRRSRPLVETGLGHAAGAP